MIAPLALQSSVLHAGSNKGTKLITQQPEMPVSSRQPSGKTGLKPGSHQGRLVSITACNVAFRVQPNCVNCCPLGD